MWRIVFIAVAQALLTNKDMFYQPLGPRVIVRRITKIFSDIF